MSAMELPIYRPEGEWQPVSRAGLAGWLIFYGLFLLYAYRARGGFLLIDHVNLVIHEGGHFFFSWFGYTLTILGGTLMELIVPLCIAIYFWWHRKTTGLAFALFWMFENFLYIGSYMADARSLSLPLVGSGDHDWEILFGQWGVLHKDRIIGGNTRILGWLGMLATVGWFAWFAWRNPPPAKRTF
ncbi:MAG TPA: hypothetical protein VGA40_01635 [Candidatus Acidoferrales bacterium]